MTRARMEEVAADGPEARRLARQAEAHLRSAQAAGVDRESAYGLCYQAALKACIATLLARGRRVTAGTGGHVLILREATARLGAQRDLADRLDAMRRARHRIFYDAVEVSELELDGAREDAQSVVSAAIDHLGPR